MISTVEHLPFVTKPSGAEVAFFANPTKMREDTLVPPRSLPHGGPAAAPWRSFSPSSTLPADVQQEVARHAAGLTCPVALGLPSEPVVLACGHLIDAYVCRTLESQGGSSWPLRKEGKCPTCVRAGCPAQESIQKLARNYFSLVAFASAPCEERPLWSIRATLVH